MIRWLPKAQSNLNAELERIAEADPAAAKRLAVLIQTRTETLAHFPESGRPGRVPGTRELVLSGLPYILPYRIRGANVEILRFFHTAQEIPPKW